MSQHLLFASFSDANSFLKKIRIGKIQRKPNTDLYIWDSEYASLTEQHKNMIEEADGSIFVWTDTDTGLTWLFEDHMMWLDLKRLNATSYGGHDDWRVPTLRELKTLSSNVKNKFGCYVKEGLKNRLRGNYESCTPYRHWTERAWWNFDIGQSTTEEYSEGKIRWGSEGNYAGFEKDTIHNSAQLILVRGIDTQFLCDWAICLRDWAESNELFEFPVTQKNIEELERLHLGLARPTAEISRLPNLKFLSCKANLGIEDVLFSITGLEELVLDAPYKKPCLEEIPASVRNLRHLVSFRANLFGLKKIHEAIGSLERLQSLDLKINKLESIPNSIGDLGELRSLDLSSNEITVIPNSIGQLQQLEKFFIGGHFDHLPESIGNLAQLLEINIRSDKLTEISNGVYNLSKLKSLVCKAPLREVSHRLVELKSLKILIIENALLESMPNDVFAMSWLHSLSIIGAPMKRIPDEISGMSNLELLDLSRTQITELPRSLLRLENLRFLNVSATQINSLPEWLSEMKSLSIICGQGVKFPEVLRNKRAIHAPYLIC